MFLSETADIDPPGIVRRGRFNFGFSFIQRTWEEREAPFAIELHRRADLRGADAYDGDGEIQSFQVFDDRGCFLGLKCIRNQAHFLFTAITNTRDIPKIRTRLIPDGASLRARAGRRRRPDLSTRRGRSSGRDRSQPVLAVHDLG
ncbi:hypothetical protein SAE02_72680 [Skermanella aerolata]|uniref:Uncharacterized protein n=1 Tax=Skermanella aerolata TaxID=393310 RepID=A0A512E3U4_9PROT|nr:hypothetical protein SAE02_72680 [Skermanella aerolata]